MLTRVISIIVLAYAPSVAVTETAPRFDNIPFQDLVEAVLYNPKKLRAIAGSQ